MADISVRLNIDLSAVNEYTSEALSEAMNILYDKAYEKCPVRTGYMRSTISTEVKDNEGVLYVGADYSSYVEYRKGWLQSATYEAIPDIQSTLHLK